MRSAADRKIQGNISRHCFRAPHSAQLFSLPFLRQLQRHGRYTTAKPQAWQRRVLRRRCFGFVRRLLRKKKDKKPDSYRFTAAERGRLTEIFADTWQYFEQNCTEKTSWLPPDNFQEEPYRGAAMLTSPTNIGMGLMAVVSAHDMHLLDERGMFTRLERMVNSIEKLEKWHGHPFNWYNLRDLSLLRPRFISTVDSGNLFACLITTACALAECAGQAEKDLRRVCGRTEKSLRRAAQRSQGQWILGYCMTTRESFFHIGCSFEEGKLTPSHYDLLASECRLTSFFCNCVFSDWVGALVCAFAPYVRCFGRART